MKIAFQVPHLSTIYAGRTIYNGYKNAFTNQGHEFRFLTATDDQDLFFTEYKPDLLFISLNQYFLKFLNISLVLEHKKKGMKVFVNTPFWNSPFSISRPNEAGSLSENENYLNLIIKKRLGDIYYNSCEADDKRMIGFEKSTGYKHHTVLLAADPSMHFYDYSDKFACEISYLGTNLPGKRKFINYVFSKVSKKYSVKLYGQDWTISDKLMGLTQRIGQYFNVPVISSIQKPKLDLSDERKIYSSSAISLNVHEDYQREFGGDLNERTFKIPACGGFQLIDKLSAVSKYFQVGKEIVVYDSADDFIQKVEYYLDKPEERKKISRLGEKKVISCHTYNHRVKQFINIYEKIK